MSVLDYLEPLSGFQQFYLLCPPYRLLLLLLLQLLLSCTRQCLCVRECHSLKNGKRRHEEVLKEVEGRPRREREKTREAQRQDEYVALDAPTEHTRVVLSLSLFPCVRVNNGRRIEGGKGRNRGLSVFRCSFFLSIKRRSFWQRTE